MQIEELDAGKNVLFILGIIMKNLTQELCAASKLRSVFILIYFDLFSFRD